MKVDFNVKEIKNNLGQLRKAMKALTELDVFVGIPEDQDARKENKDTGISNAYLGYIHEYGVPEKNIPARPALIPGIQDTLPDAVELLRQAAKQALEGKPEAVERCLNKIGLNATKAVHARFVNNDWEPLADSTLDRHPKISEAVETVKETAPDGTEVEKEVVKKKFGKSRREKGRLNPLVDSNQLRRSYTYVIRKKAGTDIIVK